MSAFLITCYKVHEMQHLGHPGSLAVQPEIVVAFHFPAFFPCFMSLLYCPVKIRWFSIQLPALPTPNYLNQVCWIK